MQLLSSPWIESFDDFARAVDRSAVLVSPYIGSDPLERLASTFGRGRKLQIDVLTNLSADNLAQGSTDPRALALFCHTVSKVKVRHLPGLHAKVYVADDRLAIVTSSNLTGAGLRHNYEYGLRITNITLVRRIRADIEAYGQLGSEVSIVELDQLTQISDWLRERQARALASARSSLRQEFARQMEAAHETLRLLRARPGEPTNSIFSRTLVYLLRNGPLTTTQIHPLIQHIHPDLCDDSIDRIINGVRFGKR